MASEATATMITPDEDAELMRRVQTGDEAALGALMQRWEIPVKSVIGRIVLNAREAEDLAQETFVRLWQHRDKYRTAAAFRPWIFAIAVNLARNRLRWWRSRPEIALEEWSDNTGDASDGATAAVRSERTAAVRDASASLPTDLRDVIVLSEYQQMRHAEIADAVGATAKIVENRIHRARERLRLALKSRI